jgi:hypothetical protein
MRLLFVPAFLAGVLASVAAPAPAAVPKTASTPQPSRNAPADEYFGKLHVSALRLRLRIDQLAVRYQRRTESDGDLLHDAGDVESAMHSWITRYPRDVWAAPTAFHLAQLYTTVQSAPARSAARSAFQYVADTFPRTSFAHSARLRLAQGFPELHAESPVVASPAPAGAAPSASSAPVTSGASATPATSAPVAGASPATASPVPATPSAAPSTSR